MTRVETSISTTLLYIITFLIYNILLLNIYLMTLVDLLHGDITGLQVSTFISSGMVIMFQAVMVVNWTTNPTISWTILKKF